MSPRCRAFFRSRRILGLLALLAAFAPAPAALAAGTVTIGDLVFVNKALVGVGRLPSGLRDKFGETFGSGSGIALDPKSWTRTPAGYQGVFYMVPDRGHNDGNGTIDYRARVNKLSIAFTPLDDPAAVPMTERQNSVVAKLIDTILLTDAAGEALTGLDPDGIRRAANGLPDLPQAPNGRVSIDAESLVLLPDGGFLIGDEYGPYVYRFSPTGRLLAAIRPPQAFLPTRKGKDHFASNNPGPGGRAAEPPNPETGRQNNQGFEGLTLTPPAGKFLVVALQSATRQDGGTSPETRRYTRLLYYDITDLDRPRLAREHVVPLPVFETADGQAARGRAERTARARRDALPPALPRFQQRLRHRQRDFALPQHRSRRYVAGDQYRGLALRRHRAGRARWQAGGGDRSGYADPLYRHQRQCAN